MNLIVRYVLSLVHSLPLLFVLEIRNEWRVLHLIIAIAKQLSCRRIVLLDDASKICLNYGVFIAFQEFRKDLSSRCELEYHSNFLKYALKCFLFLLREGISPQVLYVQQPIHTARNDDRKTQLRAESRACCWRNVQMFEPGSLDVSDDQRLSRLVDVPRHPLVEGMLEVRGKTSGFVLRLLFDHPQISFLLVGLEDGNIFPLVMARDFLNQDLSYAIRALGSQGDPPD